MRCVGNNVMITNGPLISGASVHSLGATQQPPKQLHARMRFRVAGASAIERDPAVLVTRAPTSAMLCRACSASTAQEALRDPEACRKEACPDAKGDQLQDGPCTLHTNDAALDGKPGHCAETMGGSSPAARSGAARCHMRLLDGFEGCHIRSQQCWLR